MNEMAIQGLLHGFKPYQDGGGTITLMLNDPQWREFMAWVPSLHDPLAVVRLHDESAQPGKG